ncbi:MAG TPA: cation:proton antiporter [Thermodesulfobacteriota bacterium]|nr:cation:proton antiporter [Thermodesulfobacteriota bacterium]
MHDYPVIIFSALLVFVFGLFSKLAEKSPVTGPMFFVIVGILTGPLGLGWLDISVNGEIVRVMSEITLVLILFIDASTIDLPALVKTKGLPFRLLAIGLPLTMILGILSAWLLFPSISIWLLAMMALILSPTDAALGQAVVKSEFVPERIRQAINVESGLNDGIALPPILLCVAVMTEDVSRQIGSGYWGHFVLSQLVYGPLVGALVGFLGGWVVDRAARVGWMNDTFQRLASVALAMLAYAGAEEIHGNGFIAAYFAGLLLGVRSHAVRERLQEFGEAEGQQLSLFIFLLFGLVLVPKALPYWDTTAWIYAGLSLTMIRMLPVAVGLIGAGLDRASVGFIGWFGPRGIASILYLIVVVNTMGSKGMEYVLSVIVLTVMLSVFAHGVSALPLSRAYGRYVNAGVRVDDKIS